MDTTHATHSDMQGGQIHMQDGDDFVCPNCGCEIRLIHHGDPAKMPNMRPFTCCCGTQMEKEQRGG
jgi:hypothetical protein